MTTNTIEAVLRDAHDLLVRVKEISPTQINTIKQGLMAVLDGARVRITDSEEKATFLLGKAYSLVVDICTTVWRLIQTLFRMLTSRLESLWNKGVAACI